MRFDAALTRSLLPFQKKSTSRYLIHSTYFIQYIDTACLDYHYLTEDYSILHPATIVLSIDLIHLDRI